MDSSSQMLFNTPVSSVALGAVSDLVRCSLLKFLSVPGAHPGDAGRAPARQHPAQPGGDPARRGRGVRPGGWQMWLHRLTDCRAWRVPALHTRFAATHDLRGVSFPCWELLSWLPFPWQGYVQKPARGWQGQRATKPKASGGCAPSACGSSPINSSFWLVTWPPQTHGWVCRERRLKGVGGFCSVWFSLKFGSRNG